MPIISFWSTEDSAQLCTTATATAVASMIPTKTRYKTLITQTHYLDMSLEASFFNQDKKMRLDTADTGIDALDRLLRSNKLTPENIPNYAEPIMKGRLELLYGTFKNDVDSYSRILETMPILVDYANQKRVLITSPTTLMALLKVIMVVHKDSELNKNAKYLFKELEILGKDFKLYSKRWESLQKDIDKVTQDVKEINTTTNKLSNKFDKIQNGRINSLEDKETIE